MKTHIKFEVTFNPKLAVEVGELMSHFDLGINELLTPVTYIYSWNTTSLVDKKYISKMKKGIKNILEKDGHKVLSIKLYKKNEN